ncbi:MAG: hypothetical protein LBL21_02970, partial [Rickettsiales bacterium]|nr:hypothetical protein [Rickettsiales bacterium]
DFVAKNGGLVCLELKQDEADLACQLYSINISDIIDFEKIKYASVIDGEKIAKEYGIAARPALVFFRDGALIGKTEGYFESGGAEKELLKKKIKEIVE